MHYPSLFHLFQVDLFPFGHSGVFSSIAAAEAGKPILQNSCRVLEQTLVFFALQANVETYLRLMECPIHHEPITFLLGWDTAEAS